MSVNKRRQRTGLGIISVIGTPFDGIAFKIVIVTGTFADFGIILRAFAGRIVSITFSFAPFSVFVEIHVNVTAAGKDIIAAVGQETNSRISGGWEEHRESSGNSKN